MTSAACAVPLGPMIVTVIAVPAPFDTTAREPGGAGMILAAAATRATHSDSSAGIGPQSTEIEYGAPDGGVS